MNYVSIIFNIIFKNNWDLGDVAKLEATKINNYFLH